MWKSTINFFIVLSKAVGHHSSLSTRIHGNRFCYPGGHVRSTPSNCASNRIHEHKHYDGGEALFFCGYQMKHALYRPKRVVSLKKKDSSQLGLDSRASSIAAHEPSYLLVRFLLLSNVGGKKNLESRFGSKLHRMCAKLFGACPVSLCGLLFGTACSFDV